MADTDTAWQDAITLAPGKIGGVQVLPLTAWHCHAMQMVGVRFGFDGEGRGPTAGEVATAIAICRSRWQVGQIGVPCPSWWLIVWLWLRWIFVDWRRDALALILHVSRYCGHPQTEINSKATNGRDIGAPPFFFVAVALACKVPSIKVADALNMPLVMLYCLRAAASENDGLLTCSWATTEGPRAGDIAAGLEQARQAIERARTAQEGAANGNA